MGQEDKLSGQEYTLSGQEHTLSGQEHTLAHLEDRNNPAWNADSTHYAAIHFGLNGKLIKTGAVELGWEGAALMVMRADTMCTSLAN